MGINKIFKISNLTIILLLIAGLSLGAFAQGKGHGGGHGGGNGGGNGHGNGNGGGGGWQMRGGGQGNGNGRWGGQPAPQQQQQVQMPQVQNRGWQRRQQVVAQPQPQSQPRQQNWGGWNVERRQQHDDRRAQQQVWRQQRQAPAYAQPQPRWREERIVPQTAWRPPGQSDWKMERKANKEYLKEERRQMRDAARLQRYEAPYNSAPQWRTRQPYAETYSYPREEYRSYRNYSPQVYQNYGYAPQYNYGYTPQYDRSYPQYYNYNGYAPQNYGYRSMTRVYESYLPYSYRPAYSYYEPYYADDFVNYGPRTSWKYQLLAVVLQAFLGGRDNYGFYDPYQDRGGQYAYSPYRSRPSRYYDYPTQNVSYHTYDSYGYQPYGDDYPDVGLFDIVPNFGLTNDYPGGFGNELTMQTMSYGYDQGYYAGQYCKRHRIDEENFYDPYLSEDAGYDPYSVSIAENRRYLSEGYQLGFRDGYNASRRGYDPTEYGDVDIVSLLLGNVLNVM